MVFGLVALLSNVFMSVCLRITPGHTFTRLWMVQFTFAWWFHPFSADHHVTVLYSVSGKANVIYTAPVTTSRGKHDEHCHDVTDQRSKYDQQWVR